MEVNTVIPTLKKVRLRAWPCSSDRGIFFFLFLRRVGLDGMGTEYDHGTLHEIPPKLIKILYQGKM